MELKLVQHLVNFQRKLFDKSFYFMVRCYFRKGHALMGIKDLVQTMAAFGKALEIYPNRQLKNY
jgi:hypothetical protein